MEVKIISSADISSFNQPAPPTLFVQFGWHWRQMILKVGHFGQMTFFPQKKNTFWMGFSNADQDKTSSLIRLGRDLRNGGKKQDCQKKILELSLFVLFPFLYRGNFLRMKTTTLCNSFFFGPYLTRLGSYFCQSMSQIFFARSTRRFHVLNLICKLIRLKLVERI